MLIPPVKVDPDQKPITFAFNKAIELSPTEEIEIEETKDKRYLTFPAVGTPKYKGYIDKVEPIAVELFNDDMNKVVLAKLIELGMYSKDTSEM
jgi:isochorismate synthase EntC